MTHLMVDATGVCKSYGSNEVLRSIDFSVGAGEVSCLIGPSGSGKSTFLRCINHLESIDSGAILVDGQSIGYRVQKDHLVGLREREIAPGRASIGMVFQRFNLFAHMTALENVTCALRSVKRLNRTQADELASESLARVALKEKARHYPSQLSGGEQQRVAIARALAMSPKLMLFDEPTSALDPELVGEVLSVMRTLVETGMTMVVVTHEIAFAREIATKVTFMNEGEVVETGSPDRILGQPNSQRLREFLRAVL